ncbi:PAS fold family [Coleofasciculus chthonoplastes PCC 7420]|uniref:histidine kinase n=1 Tax=Coleofasciculus chthonoplastes PCC 7420 TaxID=118168 RepID=B4VTJ5_9CYAN|nr:ATP-binding protein [Coleofasciculus chthonoplastes]EDX74688.1 PAS fold family [Coleofasciculus chthonoplastes PCC 7420]
MKTLANNISEKLINILVVEDERIIAINLKEQLELFGHCVCAIATSGEKAVERATTLRPNLVLMDIFLQGNMDGIEAAQVIWERLSIPVIYVTGHSDLNTLERVKVSYPFGYILKPIKERELFVTIDIALHRYSREQLLTTILREMGDGVIVTDTQCHIRFLNEVAQMFTGWQFVEAIDQDLSEVFKLFTQNTRQSVNLPLRTAMENNFPFSIPKDSLLISRQTKRIPIGGTVTPIHDKQDKVIGAVLVFQDISNSIQIEAANVQLEQALAELKTTQFKLIQSEKLSSLGRMATALIQEFNNPITWICGNIVLGRSYFRDLIDLLHLYQQACPKPTLEIQQLLEQIDLEFIAQDWQKMFNSIHIGAERLMDVTLSLQALRNFSTLDELDQRMIDIQEMINSTLLLVQHRLKPQGKKPEIRVIQNHDNLPSLMGYASQLNQVFIHILNNAIDAIDMKKLPGIITIDTRLISRPVSPQVGEEGEGEMIRGGNEGDREGEEEVNSQIHVLERSAGLTVNTSQKTRDVVMIRITDNGCGMSQEVQQEIFDPFFTTKSVGTAVGLGLSVSYKIVVEKHGGKIHCHSVEGEGTTFEIELPVIH